MAMLNFFAIPLLARDNFNMPWVSGQVLSYITETKKDNLIVRIS